MDNNASVITGEGRSLPRRYNIVGRRISVRISHDSGCRPGASYHVFHGCHLRLAAFGYVVRVTLHSRAGS